MRRALSLLFSSVLLTALTACPGGLPDRPSVPDKPDTPDVPDRGGSTLDPYACGNYANTNIGKKIQTFLKATATLDKAVSDAENHVKLACVDMGREIGMSASTLEGNTKTVCNAVVERVKADLKASIKAEARLDVTYQPAVCEVDAGAIATAQARCEGSGSTGTGGSEGSAACQSSAQIEASVNVRCTPAELTIDYGADVAVDPPKLETAVKALRVGLPKIANVYGRLVVIKQAATAWGAAAADLAKAGRSILSDLGDQVICVTGQLAIAAGMVGNVMGSLDVSVSVSVEVSASAGATL